MNAYNHETSPLNTPTAETAKILVVSLMEVGEVVLSSVLCNSLKKTFPKARVDYLVHDTSAGLFQNHPYIDNVISLTDSELANPFTFWLKVRKITAQGYDLVVDAQGTYKSELISLFARERAICIGHTKRGRGFFYTNKVEPKPNGANKLAERLRLLEPLIAMGFDVKRDEQFSVTVPMALKNEMRARMEASGVDFQRAVFLMSVTSKERDKRWDLAKMQSWAQYAMDAYNAQIVLFSGSLEEQADVEAFYQAMGEHSDVHPLFTNGSVDRLAAIMSHCDLFLGNEGPARCIAQACKLPSVSIYSPRTNKSEWCGDQSELHQGVQWQDVSDLSRDEVLRLSDELQTKRAKPNAEQHKSLYSLIKLDHAIELLDAVSEAAGIPLRRDIAV